jgi:hypothetical protein
MSRVTITNPFDRMVRLLALGGAVLSRKVLEKAWEIENEWHTS